MEDGCRLPMFGDRNDQWVHLASADPILDQIDKAYPHGYSWELESFGYKYGSVPHISGHSFRKGGANALRDALLARGDTREMVLDYLLKWGRWRSVESLKHYLALTWQQLASAGQTLAAHVTRWR